MPPAKEKEKMSSLTTLGNLGFFPSYRVFNDFESLFDALTGDITASTRHPVKTPRVNIEETTTGYDIHMAVPGLSRSDFKIHTDANVLSVSVESTTEAESKSKYLTREYSYTGFARSWKLPEGCNTEDITARYDSGILTLTVPRVIKKSQRNEIRVE